MYVIEAADGSRYAIKTLKWEQEHDRGKLRQEALTLADIPHHPHVMDILGVEWVDGDPFIVLPYCERSLSDVLNVRVPPDVIRRYLRQIASGLCHLHDEVGILHLDLKPPNVLLDAEGNCLLSDFGLSKCFPQPSPSGVWQDVFMSGLTGTVAYMSPEHFVSGRLSAKSDVFAMGIMLYEMIVGKHPFLRSSLEATARSILFEEPPFPFFGRRDHLVKICRQCLAKSPDRRPTAADALRLLDCKCARALSKHRPFDLAGNINRASTYLQAGDAGKAESLLLSCLQNQPWSLLARVNLSEVYLSSNQHGKALEMAKTALDLVPWCPEESSHFPTLFTNVAYLYLAVDPKQSLQFARKALAISPNDWQALANAAEACRLLAESQEPGWEVLLAEGYRYVREALAINPHDVTSQITYGNLLLIKRDFAALSPLVVQLVNKTGGDNVPARVLLIRTLIATGQIEDAARWLEPMTRFGPLNTICNQLRADLDRRRTELSTNT